MITIFENLAWYGGNGRDGEMRGDVGDVMELVGFG